mmetsp:Transcript_25125/g.29054  ORF Transcript_25125/g.29054 Transcript_25125/m.29054 type:complete len:109 (+) Transcript_25125:54-380(+)
MNVIRSRSGNVTSRDITIQSQIKTKYTTIQIYDFGSLSNCGTEIVLLGCLNHPFIHPVVSKRRRSYSRGVATIATIEVGASMGSRDGSGSGLDLEISINPIPIPYHTS